MQHSPDLLLTSLPERLFRITHASGEPVWTSIDVVEGLESFSEAKADDDLENNVWNGQQVGSFNEALSNMAHDAACRGNFVLTLGGDQSLAAGSIAGLRRKYPTLGIIWVDAHAVRLLFVFARQSFIFA